MICTVFCLTNLRSCGSCGSLPTVTGHLVGSEATKLGRNGSQFGKAILASNGPFRRCNKPRLDIDSWCIVKDVDNGCLILNLYSPCWHFHLACESMGLFEYFRMRLLSELTWYLKYILWAWWYVRQLFHHLRLKLRMPFCVAQSRPFHVGRYLFSDVYVIYPF